MGDGNKHNVHEWLMGTDEIVSEVLGYIGLILWSFQLAPQVYRNYKEKDTGVLSIWMMVCWTLWTPFFAAAAIAKHLVAPTSFSLTFLHFLPQFVVFKFTFIQLEVRGT